MDISTPLFLVVLRQWVQFDPTSTAFIQVLPFLASIASIAVLWWLVRTLGGSLWTRVIVTTIGAVAPDAVEYSMRVKEYSTEMLLGLLLLVALAKAIQHPTPKRTTLLLAACVVACLTSGTLVLFVVGVLGAFVIDGIRRRRARDPWLIAYGAGTVAAVGATYFAFYDHIPPALQQFWSTFEFSASNTRPLGHKVAIIGEGIAHGLVGTPLLVGTFPDPYSAISKSQYANATLIAAAFFACLFAGIAAVLWRSRKQADVSSAVGIAAVIVLLIAIAASVSGHAPLGGGRTDIWWYPAAWCLLAILVEDLLRVIGPRLKAAAKVPRNTLTLAGAAVLVAVAVPFGYHFRAWYPSQDVRGLFAQDQGELRHADWVYVARPVSFAWAFYGLGQFQVVFDSGSVHTNQGWSVSQDRFNLQETLTSDPASLCGLTRSIWWVGPNPYASNPNNYKFVGAVDNKIGPPTAPFSSLLGLGWKQTQVIAGVGVNAQLFTHPQACT
jgi:hypothetical protein